MWKDERTHAAAEVEDCTSIRAVPVKLATTAVALLLFFLTASCLPSLISVYLSLFP